MIKTGWKRLRISCEFLMQYCAKNSTTILSDEILPKNCLIEFKNHRGRRAALRVRVHRISNLSNNSTKVLNFPIEYLLCGA